ncbi:hypothetical protein AB0V39_01400 [Mesorhizobium ciceri]|uniref:hypothetical protein n=1 Tax=Mesorhizobium ciceri TaxID=39645 RepID=UPI0013E8D3B7|nr:hypothetical protein [Mesorhizobium ciceri]
MHRILRTFFAVSSFGRFVTLYLLLDVAVVIGEFAIAHFAPNWIPDWTASGPPPQPDVKAIILNVSSYLITAQVGVLGVISLALALVTLIAQRENSSTDVKLYYHESLAFEVVASCVALLAVMCAQLLWPLQFSLHRFGFGTNFQAFKLVLLGAHSAWLLVNLAGLAHFIATTFNFVQQSAREKLRERYTVNFVQPLEMKARLRQQLYALATQELLGSDQANDQPSATFGFDFGGPHISEINTKFERRMALYDVRMIWVRWVLRRWVVRCSRAAVSQPSLRTSPTTWGRWILARWSTYRNGGAKALPKPRVRPTGYQGPILWFTPHIDEPLNGSVSWCRRRGGVALNRLELWVLRRAFCFRGVNDES